MSGDAHENVIAAFPARGRIVTVENAHKHPYRAVLLVDAICDALTPSRATRRPGPACAIRRGTIRDHVGDPSATSDCERRRSGARLMKQERAAAPLRSLSLCSPSSAAIQVRVVSTRLALSACRSIDHDRRHVLVARAPAAPDRTA